MATETDGRPRIGISYRTRKEELASDRSRYDLYVEAVRMAGGEPVEVSLGLSTSALTDLARALDGFLLPGSPADVNPSRYGAPRHPKCADADADRERTDCGLLENALGDQKPVLAICYGAQSLNVFLGGSLIQDIPAELDTSIHHDWDRQGGEPEPFHSARAEQGSELTELARAFDLRVNSSHHQSILKPGRDLRVTATAPDGVVEAVEWIGDRNTIVGVQWHPERMVETDRLARALFESLVDSVRKGARDGTQNRA